MTTAEIDASAGLDAEAAMVITVSYAGDMATAMRSQIGSIPRDQLETLMMSSFDDNRSNTTIEGVETRYDDAANMFHMIMRGKTRLSWVNNTGGRLMTLDGTSLVAPTGEERKGLYRAFADHPYGISHPFMTRSVMRVTLPDAGRGYRLEGGDQTVEDAAFRLTRVVRLEDGVAEAVVTQTSLAPEMSAADMAASRDRAESASITSVRLRAPADYAATAADQARLETGDSDVRDLVERAGRLAQAGDAAGAVALLDSAIERDADNADAIKARAAARISLNNYAGAAEDYDRAVELDPADVEAAVGQGLVARIDGRNAEAIVSYSVALRLEPDNVQALVGRGAAYYQIGRWDRSLADYQALKSAYPESEAGLNGELRALRRLNRLEEAQALVEGRLETDPTDVVALQGVARLAIDQDQPADALAVLDPAIDASPTADALIMLRAETRVRAGDTDGARDDYATLRRRAAGDPWLLNNICWSMAVLAFDLDRALVDCDAASASGEAGVIDSRALVLLQLERFKEARVAYDQALAAAPSQSSSLYGRGLARLALSDASGSDDIQRALEIDIDAAEDFEAFFERRPELRP